MALPYEVIFGPSRKFKKEVLELRKEFEEILFKRIALLEYL